MSLPLTLDGYTGPDDSDRTQVPAATPAATPGHALVTADGGRMGVAGQARVAFWVAWRAMRRKAKDTSGRDGHWLNHELTTPPPSVAAQVAYKRSKGWVPAGHEGGLVDRWGTAFQTLVAVPGVAVFGWLAKTCASLWRFAITATVVILLTATVLVLFGAYTAAELAAGIPVGLTLAVAVTVALWPEHHDRDYQPEADVPEGGEG